MRTIAIKVLENESNAIKNLIQYLNSDFDAAIKVILNSKGRVIISGIGKSAIIAQKIVATLNSTGTPSIFMHAADAIHGDLGIIQKEDVVICISKSGNTSEIKVLIPLIKRLNIPLISIVGNIDSYLAKNSTYVINSSIDEEACPNNLAPTTSTTAQLAMGDAIAICLLESKNFTKEDFAKFHPGGALGKRLYLKVDDIIKNNETPIVKENANFEEVILEITSKRLGATAVTDLNNNLIGIITDGDLRRNFSKNTASLIAKDIMSISPKFITTGAYATEALAIMQQNNISQVIVTNTEHIPVGFVHLHDLLKEGIV